MPEILSSDERGSANHGWLDSRHTFSFADYYDPQRMGFGPLRVINEDRVRPGAGFPTHPHRDMEILSYVIDGALEHADSLGTGSVIRRGEIQYLRAGTGVTHSEYNHSQTEPVHFLQIWIVPGRLGAVPHYDQRALAEAERENRWLLMASSSGREGSIEIQRDVDVYSARLDQDVRLTRASGEGRGAWLQVVRGRVQVAGAELAAGDAAAFAAGEGLELVGAGEAELLLFDVPLSA